ncbi:AraC family transcriptional regulator [Devosia soli]|uniref:AraC family transcriptional regulator n=1 Tax=Devosia soli TaxID=361041 RepID=UPI000A837966|nr:helix-turn-helix domain-containing protein [Devosia soli]
MGLSGRLHITSRNADIVSETITSLVSGCRAIPTKGSDIIDYQGDFIGWSDFALGEASTASGFALETTAYGERMICAVSAKGHLVYAGQGRELVTGSGEVVIADSQSIETARFSENYAQYFVTTSMRSIEGYVREHFGKANRSFSGSCAVLPRTHLAAVSLSGFTPLINMLLAEKELLKLSPITMRRCQDAFLEIIASSLSANGVFLGRKNDPLSSSRNLREAEDFMRQHAREPIGVAEVAQAVGISVRSLQLAYKRYTGITPLARLQRFRLEGLHADLDAGLAENVRTAAAAWGFVSGARLNRQYLEAFGETPADTVKRVTR